MTAPRVFFFGGGGVYCRAVIGSEILCVLCKLRSGTLPCPITSRSAALVLRRSDWLSGAHAPGRMSFVVDGMMLP